MIQSNNKGFSYIQLLVAIAVGAIATLGLAQVLNMANQGLRGVETSNEVTQLYNELTAATANQTVCKNNFDVNNGNSANAALLGNLANAIANNSPIDLNAIEYFDDNNLPVGVLLSTSANDGDNDGIPDNVRGGVTIQRISLIPKFRIAQNQLVADLEVSITKRGEVLGPEGIKRSLPLFMTLDDTGSMVIDCSSRTDAAGGTFYDKICEINSGGLDEYNEATGQCEPKFPTDCAGQNLSGTATCPVGKIAAPGGPKNACKAVPPGGFSDPPSTPRLYQGGSSRTLPPALMFVNYATNSCTCEYAIGVDPTGWRCEVCCMDQP